MRKISHFIYNQAVSLAAAALVLASSASLNAATTTPYPLNGPWAMTLAPNGQLYVANQHAGQVLVYGTNLVQIPSKTITAGLKQPTGLAFDSKGELYVCDISTNIINVYSPSGALLPSRSIVTHTNRPVGLAMDGLDDLWVDNNFTEVSVFSHDGTYRGDEALPQSVVDSVTVRGSQFAMGTPGGFTLGPSYNALISTVTGNLSGYAGLGANQAMGTTYDSAGNLYVVTYDPYLIFVNTSANAATVLVSLDYYPQAVAVDDAHNHIFVSDFQNSVIYVYNLQGELLTTLH